MKKILRGLLAVMAFAVCMAGAISIPSRAEEAYTSENEAEATDAELQTTAGAELATVKNGWVNVKGGRKYYENGKAVKGWMVRQLPVKRKSVMPDISLISMAECRRRSGK